MKNFLLLILTGLLALCVMECQKKVTKTKPLNVGAVEKTAHSVEGDEPLVIDMAKGSDTSAQAQKSADYLPIYFDYDKADITRESEQTLMDISRNFKGTLKISGHCDERGSFMYNDALGMRRAQSVETWLRQHGFDRDKLRAVSFGKRNPVKSNCKDEACHAQNRRVEFHIQP